MVDTVIDIRVPTTITNIISTLSPPQIKFHETLKLLPFLFGSQPLMFFSASSDQIPDPFDSPPQPASSSRKYSIDTFNTLATAQRFFTLGLDLFHPFIVAFPSPAFLSSALMLMFCFSASCFIFS